MAEGSIFFNALSKSSFVTLIFSSSSSDTLLSPKLKSGNNLLSDAIAASLHNASRSAPTKPWVLDAKIFKSTSSVKGIDLV
ncbi:MAG: hypothetical protein AMQ22_02116 [Candidatus Methanofastidiosum methylothiophilum]|uniref:Uncharacterized protein n=1 Tax=Candidatus Methanofastidiosum methylothiophilum TaxID=1705564 RepID=A0A150INT6_9EURY|nr:MAG: hypothetical protein AMQ22_02116 [Candidatus Methanofastidiosum methylthiophilus]